MNTLRDPHVERLHYKVGSGKGISYRDPKPVEFSHRLGTFKLSDGRLVYEPADHFADQDAARQAVEPFLRAWEIEADLKSNIGMIRFKFDRSEVVDRDPPPPGTSLVLQGKAATAGFSATIGSLHLTCREYPHPPQIFETTLDVEHCHRRWSQYRAGKEPLQSMAYFVLTVVERNSPKKKRRRDYAAQNFQIDKAVLNKIGDLSTEKGDEATARKAPHGRSFQKLSGPEKQWLEQAVRRVIRRMGERASGAPLTLITPNDIH